jgi:hypothetical protein
MPDRESPLVPGGREPYLSVVATARNDDHGGNLLGRMQAFVNCWLGHARRYAIDSELILVEWNPPPDRPRLAEALHWPADTGPCDVRIIEVPAELHARYAHGAALPLYQMIGKNAGIRRARGRFVLATNIDILMSSELAEFLAGRRLDPGHMYRIDRHDAMSDVPVDATPEEQIRYCRSHLIRVNRREGTYDVTPEGRPRLGAVDAVGKDCGILFGEGWLPPAQYGEQEAFRWAGACAELLFTSAAAHDSVLWMDLEPGPGAGSQPLDLEVMEGERQIARFQIDSRRRLRLPIGGPVDRLSFVVHNPGVGAGLDPRILMFRVFDLRWKHTEDPAPQPTVTRLSLLDRARILWGGVHHILQKLATEGPLVNLTVFVSPALRRIARLCLRIFWKARFPAENPEGPAHERPPEPPPQAAPVVAPAFLHTNGCGDFTLLARERWFDLRAYAEFDFFSMNLDSLFCFAAHHGGAPEAVLPDPLRIYHIEHGKGSGWTPEGQKKLFDRIAALGLPMLDNDAVLQMAQQMRRLDAPMIFNSDNWGLVDFDLPETTPVHAHARGGFIG